LLPFSADAYDKIIIRSNRKAVKGPKSLVSSNRLLAQLKQTIKQKLKQLGETEGNFKFKFSCNKIVSKNVGSDIDDPVKKRFIQFTK